MNSLNEKLAIDATRLGRELDALAGFSATPGSGVTRVLFTDTDLQVRAYLAELYQAAGLRVRQDAAGNVFARWHGSEPALPAVGTGSHADAIPHSGKFDGTVGVLGGLEAIRALQDAEFQPTRSIELIMFTAEEPTRYGVGCLGSRLLAGAIEPDKAATLLDEDGASFEETRQRAGCDGDLPGVRLSADAYGAFVELHIEQGPSLEQQGVPIGVVTAIAAPAALRVTYGGSGGHAGAVLMAGRNDSLLAASELALAVEEAALRVGGEDTVATTGVLDVFPRAINSIPSKAYLEIDVRDIELERRDRVVGAIQDAVREIGKRRGQQIEMEMINADPPAMCDGEVTSAIEAACDEAGLVFQRMISRAYHDSLFMAMTAPTAMIFIPCKDGVSHRPEEYASPDWIEAGVRVLALTLARLSQSKEP